ncbi:OLC1v1005443C1 [Oldenlandia corymbosa var. corymbosa]|uniref:OLC1v1005443C1 n=1 Tax=Oldenlandia corymbosa var. corymbosa TaxID=529605 RepID=A0AAV1DH17_OLDCO|nr:OLC1v1005443C1 [Oldenlandia corymbosa var. corymbosa]
MPEDQSPNVVVDMESTPFILQEDKVKEITRKKDTTLLDNVGGVEGVIGILRTDKEEGIPGDDDDLNRRRERFGSNSITSSKHDLLKGFYLCAVKAVTDPLIIILLVYSVVYICFGINERGIKSVWPERGTKLLEIVAVVIVSAVTNFWPITQLHDVSSAEEDHVYCPRVDVVRNRGQAKKIPVSEVVVGDIVFLKPGDLVPAAGLFIDGHSLKLKELTNATNEESVNRAEVGKRRKREKVGLKNRFLSSGTMVASGAARMVVTAMEAEKPMQPQQEATMMGEHHVDELRNLTAIIGRFGKGFALLTFLWFLFRFGVETKYVDDDAVPAPSPAPATAINDVQKADIVVLLTALLGMLGTSAIIALTSGLEGLVLAVKSTLAYSMRSLLQKQVLIKKPSLCHQVASVDTICFNKTETLTSDTFEVITVAQFFCVSFN